MTAENNTEKKTKRTAYKVIRSAIFVANPKGKQAIKKCVGDTVRLTAAEAKHFNNLGHLAPVVED